MGRATTSTDLPPCPSVSKPPLASRQPWGSGCSSEVIVESSSRETGSTEGTLKHEHWQHWHTASETLSALTMYESMYDYATRIRNRAHRKLKTTNCVQCANNGTVWEPFTA